MPSRRRHIEPVREEPWQLGRDPHQRLPLRPGRVSKNRGNLLGLLGRQNARPRPASNRPNQGRAVGSFECWERTRQDGLSIRLIYATARDCGSHSSAVREPVCLSGPRTCRGAMVYFHLLPRLRMSAATPRCLSRTTRRSGSVLLARRESICSRSRHGTGIGSMPYPVGVRAHYLPSSAFPQIASWPACGPGKGR